ncbi:SphA family protein [Pseudomonas putida]|uniref:SphA family protein n=1 Tax=Pseudomonas putida TaxID=303 RepID=UPI001F52ADCF|nr:transporter [Pseudomonas putida]MCI1035892.1 transporter [Pseudomonas putida]
MLKQATSIALFSLGIATLPALAVEGGRSTTASGVYDFTPGFGPAPSDDGYWGMRLNVYSSTKQMNARGKKADVKLSAKTASLGFAYMRMTNSQLLGANYGYAFIAPFMAFDVKVRQDVGNGQVFSAHEKFWNQSDFAIMPIFLQWNIAPNFGINASLQIQAPTGDYKKTRITNPGLNIWDFSPALAVTYITDSGIEFSSAFNLDFTTRNPATDYKNGTEYRHEFAVGKHVGDWTIGAAGYYYRQLSDDDSPNLVEGVRARGMALGPAISYHGKKMPPIWFHIYKEFGVENLTEGYASAIRVAYQF